jgi:hypothetical protein
MRRKGEEARNQTNKREERAMKTENKKMLEKIYEALGGIVSEQGVEAFDHFYKGGGKQMFADFEKVLAEECGVKFAEPEYKVVPMKGAKWGGLFMIVDQTGAPVLTGMSKADAEWTLENVVKAA